MIKVCALLPSLFLLSTSLAFSSSPEAPAKVSAKAPALKKKAAKKVNGFEAGNFIIKPRFGVFEKFHNNIYTRQNGKKSDAILVLSPELVVESDPSAKPNKIKVNAGLNHNYYGSNNRDTYTDFFTGLNNRYTFDNGGLWDLTGQYRRLHSARGDNQTDPTANAVGPIPYNVVNVDTAFYKRLGDFTVRPHAGFNYFYYEKVDRLNGGFLTQSQRNHTAYLYGGTIGYDIAKAFQIFTDLEGNTHKYKHDFARTGRDSHGGDYILGVQYRPHAKLLAKLGGGYMHRTWSNSQLYKRISTWKSLARLDWQYHEMSKLRAQMTRSINEVTDRNTSAAVRTDYTLSLNHSLAEKLFGIVGGRHARYEYQGGRNATGGLSDRRDRLYEGMVGLAYKYTNTVTFTTDYTYTRNKSNISTSNYNKSVILVGVKFGFYD